MVALFHRFPKALVTHDHGVNDAEGVERELVLAQDAELLRADDAAFLRFLLAREQFHERGFARAVGAGETVALAGRERGVHIFKEDLCAEAHGNIDD